VRRRRLWLGVLIAFAFLLRLVLIRTRGDFLEFDEAYYLLIARSLSSGAGFAMNGLPQIAFPPLPALLLAAMDRLFGSMVEPSRIASALFGALLVVPVHRVCRRWLGRRASWRGALLTAVSPALMTFVPVQPRYADRLYFGHEPLYLLLVYGTVWALVGFLRRPGARAGAALGVAAGLAYLTRNESILFSGPAVALAVVTAWRRRREHRRALLAAAIAVASLGAVAAPYPIYLHHVTGAWTLTGKTGTAARIRPTIVVRVRDNDSYPFEAAHYALASSGDRMASSYWGYSGRQTDPGLSLSAAGIADNVGVYLRVLLPALFPWMLWPFILNGLVSPLLRDARARRLSRVDPMVHLAAFLLILPSLAVTIFLFVEPRHHLYLVPLGLMMAASGCVEPAIRGRRYLLAFRLLSAALPALMLLAALLPLLDLSKPGDARAEASQIRRGGEALARELPAGEPLMSWHPALAFWAAREWRVIPSARMPQIAAYALARGAATMVFERSVFGAPPGAPAGATAPFTIIRIEGLTRDEADRSLFRMELVEAPRGDPLSGLFLRYVLKGAGGKY